MHAKLSSTQVDRLGGRLRSGPVTESDLRLLDGYRQSFGETYEVVVRTIRGKLELEPTGRPAKSTTSIIEKLRRESIRLSQIQDIAGCRMVMSDVLEQDRTVEALRDCFPAASVIDRRVTPSHGYRAVHIIPRISDKLVEIQVRSLLQHLWAELSEKLSDVLDPSIKYGGGETAIREGLAKTSEIVGKQELFEQKLATSRNQAVDQRTLHEVEQQIADLKVEIVAHFGETISYWEAWKGRRR